MCDGVRTPDSEASELDEIASERSIFIPLLVLCCLDAEIGERVQEEA